jgi:hypothetical protein
MKLNPPFIKKTVQPGDPLSAQAWNDVVVGVDTLFTFIEASEASAVQVQIANQGIDLSSVRVTATRDDGISIEAVDPVADGTLHTFPGLRPGAYKLRAEAPGFQPASVDIVVPADGSLPTQTITLLANGAFMPGLFGQDLATSLAQLASLGIAVSAILDVTGTAVPVASPGSAYNQSLVLLQLPPQGVPVAPGQAAQLVISAALQAEASIEMPSLAGLTFAEASKALEALGLKVGKSYTKQPPRAL